MGAGVCDGEGERAYTVYVTIIGGEKYLKSFLTLLNALQEQKPRTAKTEQINLKSLHSFSIWLFAHTKTRSKCTRPHQICQPFQINQVQYISAISVLFSLIRNSNY